MNRRNLFKMLGAVVASAACAPLAKLFPIRPQPRPRLTINPNVIPIRYFVREDLALSEEDFVKHYVRPRFKLALDAEEKDRGLALEDLAAIMRKTDEDLKAVTGLYEPSLGGGKHGTRS